MQSVIKVPLKSLPFRVLFSHQGPSQVSAVQSSGQHCFSSEVDVGYFKELSRTRSWLMQSVIKVPLKSLPFRVLFSHQGPSQVSAVQSSGQHCFSSAHPKCHAQLLSHVLLCATP